MNQLLIDLKNKLNPIVELIKDKNDVFYFDYPLHSNVGDLLIYHGTEQFFKDHHINVTLKRCEYDLDLEEVKAKITPNTTILLHGGGNFGDLYPQHQKIREEMVTHFPNNRIIVLPQTAYFKHEENLQKSAALFRNHSDCHLLARDERTANLFAKFSDHVYLSPDMAHQLYGTMETKQGKTGKKLYFLRKDIEASDVEKNILIFLDNDKVITTRLHGHIFSCLLEIPNVVCDNSYGKNSSYAKLWTQNLNFVELDKSCLN